MKSISTIIVLLVPSLLVAQDQRVNPIQIENKKEGTKDWLLFNYDKVVPGKDEIWKREKGIEGYCSQVLGQGLVRQPPLQFVLKCRRLIRE